jgi:hypothetical protein
MKQSQLNELVKFITKAVLKEFTLMSASSQNNNSTTDMASDPSTPPTDAMTSAEKSKQEREQKANRLKDIRTAEMDLKGTKTQSAYFSQQIKQNKLQTIAQQKNLQNLKAGKTVSTGGAGSVSP